MVFCRAGKASTPARKKAPCPTQNAFVPTTIIGISLHQIKHLSTIFLENKERTVIAHKISPYCAALCGLPANINRGLKAATGEDYKGIAGDDYMTEDAIACYVRFCETHPNVFPVAKVHLFNDKNPDALYADVQAYCDRCYDFAQKDYREQYRMLLVQNRIVAPSATFYTMDFIRKTGGYEECYRWFEDYPMNLEAMHAGYKFGLLDKEIVWYRMSDQSVTSANLSRLKKTEMKLFFRKRFWYLFQNGMGWEAVKQCKSWLKVLVQK